ncbi:MAG: alpha-hydroxy-acid oxidizing enzyme [Rhodospirillales bacterium 70-18]|nr:MAG: alpha-hydroxy-acid oxidizing enzyme [Rhodospirillales bacterium 70-18]
MADLREAARRTLPRFIFEFIDRGAEDEVAVAHNRAAFERIKIRGRSLVDISQRDLSTTLFGRRMAMPAAVAPMSPLGLAWYQGELAMARAAAAAGVPYTLPTMAMTPMDAILASAAERIAGESGARLWFQLYTWEDRAASDRLVSRARDAGFEALLVTVDTAVSPNREYNQRNGFVMPFRFTPNVMLDMLRHPAWLARVMGRYLTTTGLPRMENYPTRHRATRPSNDPGLKSTNSLSWDDIRRLRDLWPGKLLIKGVMRGDDAAQAMEHGLDGVVVSNHGGRNLDSAVAPIEVLAEVVAAVAGRGAVLMDSGVRRGSDILKALALGADAVLLGRPMAFGMATAGQAGAARALALLREEFSIAMAYGGCRSVADITPDLLAAFPQGAAAGG